PQDDGGASRTAVQAEGSLAPTRADAAVHSVDHAGGITGAVGRKKSHQGADLAGVRGAAERKTLLEFLVAVLVAELVFCARLQKRDMAIGADRAWIDCDHADIVGEALAAQRAGKRHPRGIAGAAADVVGVEF